MQKANAQLILFFCFLCCDKKMNAQEADAVMLLTQFTSYANDFSSFVPSSSSFFLPFSSSQEKKKEREKQEEEREEEKEKEKEHMDIEITLEQQVVPHFISPSSCAGLISPSVVIQCPSRSFRLSRSFNPSGSSASSRSSTRIVFSFRPEAEHLREGCVCSSEDDKRFHAFRLVKIKFIPPHLTPFVAECCDYGVFASTLCADLQTAYKLWFAIFQAKNQDKIQDKDLEFKPIMHDSVSWREGVMKMCCKIEQEGQYYWTNIALKPEWSEKLKKHQTGKEEQHEKEEQEPIEKERKKEQKQKQKRKRSSELNDSNRQASSSSSCSNNRQNFKKNATRTELQQLKENFKKQSHHEFVDSKLKSMGMDIRLTIPSKCSRCQTTIKDANVNDDDVRFDEKCEHCSRATEAFLVLYDKEDNLLDACRFWCEQEFYTQTYAFWKHQHFNDKNINLDAHPKIYFHLLWYQQERDFSDFFGYHLYDYSFDVFRTIVSRSDHFDYSHVAHPFVLARLLENHATEVYVRIDHHQNTKGALSSSYNSESFLLAKSMFFSDLINPRIYPFLSSFSFSSSSSSLNFASPLMSSVIELLQRGSFAHFVFENTFVDEFVQKFALKIERTINL